MNHLRLVAGSFVGTGAMILLLQGEQVAAVGLLGTMLGFFIGESNGRKQS